MKMGTMLFQIDSIQSQSLESLHAYGNKVILG